MTVPALIQTTQKKELEVSFKKQYSLLKQAIKTIKYTDYLEFNNDNYGTNTMSLRNRLAKEYKVIKNCATIATGNCVFKEEDGSFKYYKSYSNGNLDYSYWDDGGFITLDGIIFFLEQGNQSKTSGYLITVDVNGYQKKPNRMGYDLFMFQLTEDGEVIPMGANNTYFSDYKTQYCSKSSTSTKNGYTCAYYALTDKDYFGKL